MANKINYGTKSADVAYPIVDATKQWTFEDANEVKTKHNLNDDRITALEAIDTGNRYGSILLGDITAGSVGRSDYVISGDIASVQKTAETTYGDELTVTLNVGMADANYFVRSFIESLSTSMASDNNLNPIVFKKLNAMQFKLYIEEEAGVTQNIKLHIEVIKH